MRLGGTIVETPIYSDVPQASRNGNKSAVYIVFEEHVLFSRQENGVPRLCVRRVSDREKFRSLHGIFSTSICNLSDFVFVASGV